MNLYEVLMRLDSGGRASSRPYEFPERQLKHCSSQESRESAPLKNARPHELNPFSQNGSLLRILH